MARAAKKITKDASLRGPVRSIKRFHDLEMVSEANLAREISEVLRRGGLRVLDRDRSRGLMGDLLVTRPDLGRERRFTIEIVLEINNEKIQEHFTRYRNYVRQTKQPFAEFDEYWLVGYRYAHEPMRKRPGNDRHFRVLDLDELQKLFAPPPSRKSKGNARTKVGKAVEANEKEILLAVAALMLQIEDKLTVLRAEFPNYPETIAKRDAAISDLEGMHAELEHIRAMIVKFRTSQVKEAEVVKSVQTFSEGVRLWWNKNHDRICDKAYDMGMFATAVTICSMAGASGNIGVALSAALVGGKPVADVVKGLAKRFLPS
jgi:hypothetical protein